MSETIYILDQNGTRDDLISWEYIKFEKRPHSITFSKNWKFLEFLKFFNAGRERILKNLIQITLVMETIYPVKQNFIISVIKSCGP